MGCLFASFLTEAGEDVWLIDHNPERASKVSKRGIRLEGISGERRVKVKITASPQEVGMCELILVCVKSYDTRKAIENNLSLVGSSSYVLTLQNGVGNMEIISVVVGGERTIGGTTSQGATLLGDGYIRHAGKGETSIGEADPRFSNRGQSPRLRQGSLLRQGFRRQTGGRAFRSPPFHTGQAKLKEIAMVLEGAGFKTKVVDNIQDLIWSKLIINVGINALTAITGLKNGKLVEIPYTEKVLEKAVREAIAVAQARGITLTFKDPVEKVKSVCRATAGNVSSMLQDVLKKKRTEIDFINGAIVKEAGKFKIDVPVNCILTTLIKAIEETYKEAK